MQPSLPITRSTGTSTRAWLLAALLAACGAPAVGPGSVPVTISGGGGAYGAFDPSLARDPASGRLWMSYSAVGPVANPATAPWGVSQRLAWSDDRGATWTDAGVWVSRFTEEATATELPTTPPEPPIPAGSTVTVQHETSTLVHDPDDPGAPWKLLWHQVLWAGGSPHFVSYSFIALKEAATPLDLADAPIVPLFGGYGLQPGLGTPAIDLSVLDQDPELSTCVFAEPGLLATPAALYLTIDCHALGPSVTPYVVLFTCPRPCAMTEATGWHYLGRTLAPDDAKAIDAGYKGFSGTAFATQGGETYLLATPVDADGDRYDGCRVYRFADLAAGLLERSAGRPVTVRQVTGLAGTHHGACAHHPEVDSGILYSQFTGPSPPEFRIYQSRVGSP